MSTIITDYTKIGFAELKTLKEKLAAQIAACGYERPRMSIELDKDNDISITLQMSDGPHSYKTFYIWSREKQRYEDFAKQWAEFLEALPNRHEYEVGKLRERIVEDLAKLDDSYLEPAEQAAIRAKLESVVESLSNNILTKQGY